MESIPISVQGLEKVHQELEELKKERPLVVQAIKEAREEGDLRENAGYDAAKERQGMLEAKINFIESRIPFYNVIDMDTLGGDVITFGATVTLKDMDTDEEKTYTLMGPDESNVKKGIISVLSPVGQALLGKEEGDEILVEAPRGRIEYEIISVTFNGATTQ
jgi:transcription elongation factor GreA